MVKKKLLHRSVKESLNAIRSYLTSAVMTGVPSRVISPAKKFANFFLLSVNNQETNVWSKDSITFCSNPPH